MGRDTTIAWTHATANTAWGCKKVDLACKNCYMFRLRSQWGESGEEIKFFDLERLVKKIASWPPDKKLIFLNDMTDTFGEFYSFDLIKKWHTDLIEKLPDREFQLLTKRIGRAMVFYRDYYPPENVWIGCSIGERSRLRRLEQLTQINAKIRFVSFEPVIEDLGDFSLKGIQWAIIGGESDKVAPREMKPAWAESIRQICERDGVAFMFKQIGGIGGDGAGGNLLNGKEYREFPDY